MVWLLSMARKYFAKTAGSLTPPACSLEALSSSGVASISPMSTVRWAPGSPEIEQHYLVLEIVQVPHLALKIFKYQRG